MFEPKHHYPDISTHTSSYYAASRNDVTDRPAVNGNVEADICIVGAGFSGLSTALHLAEAGFDVAVIEGVKIGWGASGRNGGQIVNGLNASLDRIQKKFGDETTRQVGSMLQEGGRIIRERINRYNIQCDFKNGNIFAAYTDKHMREFEAKQSLWRKHGMDDHEILDSQALTEHVGSTVYTGGMLDRSGGHLHPLNLALGEAAAIESLGGRIYENSRVVKINREDSQPVVTTDRGQVRCRTLVLCGNAYLGQVEPSLTSRVMPVSTQIVTTSPLDEQIADSLLPTDYCVEDARYILDYYRLTADRRLLFGGGTVYGGTDPADIVKKLRPALERVFPQLR
ncbi:MAG: FAD-binding oxidoreductase, partial [Granulosicoccus sp.]|nr:FAD-binding oxidoreductase [Granulosicoccus sp.]